MSDLAKILARIDEVLKRGTFESERAWCRAAKIAPSYIGALRTRASTGEVKDVKREKIAALARVAGVSLEWLSGGEGREAELANASRRVKWPARMSEARRDEITREVLAAALAQTHGRPQTLEDWVSALEARLAAEKGKAVPARVVRDE